MIIGLTGANASGKGEAAEYLKSKGFKHYSLSDILREEAEARGIDFSRDNLIKLGNELRREKGPAILAELALQKIGNKKDLIIDSIRNPFEIKVLRKLNNFTLIGIEAPVAVRFKRAISRNRPGDPKTLEEFIEKEVEENTVSFTNQQLDVCIKEADIIILNDSSLKNFQKRIDETIANIKKTGMG